MSWQRAMIKTLLGQNIAVLLVTTLFALLLSLSLVAFFVVRPETQRAANATASLADVLTFMIDEMEAVERVETMQFLDAHPDFSVKVSSEAPKNTQSPNTLSERFFLRKLKEHYKGRAFEDLQIGADGWLWMRMSASDPAIWVSVRNTPARDPQKAFAGVFTVALLSSLLGGVFLQRHLARPLKRLEDGIDNVESGSSLHVFSETGPREIAAIARALNQMSKTLHLAEIDRAVMLAGVSHDLRTPLTKLRLSLAMLQSADQDLIISAERQVVRIETMLAQFLEYARGFSEEEVKKVDLNSLLQDALTDSAARSAVTISCPSNMQARLKPGAVARAVSNLVTNADNHGAAPIRIKAQRSNGFLTIEVSDAGPGIDLDEANLLTRPFARGNSARTHEGTGLGLAIANQVVMAHGGTLGFRYSQGRFNAILTFPTPN